MHYDETDLVIDLIMKMDELQLQRVLPVVQKRWGQVTSEKELLLLSAPKNDPQAQKRILEFAFTMIDKGRE